MTLKDLSDDQRIELKQSILTERRDAIGENPSWGELADADELVSDEDLADRFDGTEFCEEDFASRREVAR